MVGDLAIRPSAPSDLDTLYEICRRTGAAGADATELVEDPRLFGELYAAPYAVLEPEHAFVLDDGDGAAVGYVLGALDTIAFEARCQAEWWPALRARHPERPGGSGLDDLLVHLIHHRSSPDPAIVAAYPSHLHINLLPVVQGQGWGRRLLDRLFDALRADGSAGVHWGVNTRNHPAIAFYEHVGCEELAASSMTRTFGVRL
ncbi:MAG: GNAT family N-acetyltransferase [Acidimicrobiales bacterium]